MCSILTPVQQQEPRFSGMLAGNSGDCDGSAVISLLYLRRSASKGLNVKGFSMKMMYSSGFESYCLRGL